jgi:hypothetical protein
MPPHFLCTSRVPPGTPHHPSPDHRVVPAINPVHYGLKTLHLRPEIVSDLLAAPYRDHYGLAVPALASFAPATESAPPPDTLVYNRAVFPYSKAQNISHLSCRAW